MNLYILSLKGLYQLLTVKDYPVYSVGIITRNNRKGLTLNKFWQENILPEFRAQKYGKMLWRSDGGRNRYLSDICNRSDRLGFYGEYAREICQAAEPDVALRQIRQFSGMLARREYRYDVLCRKLSGYLKLLAREDEAFSEEAEGYFRDAWDQKSACEKRGGEGCAFFSGWMFTFLMLHALCGNGEGEASLKILRRRPELTLGALCESYFKEREAGGTGDSREGVVYLTGKNTQLCSMPLTSHHFFGREKEMFELREMVREGGKYVISGIAGIGKTELARQLLRCCEQEALVDTVCVIQYEGSFMSSFVRAFPLIHGRDMESNFQEVIGRIRLCEGGRILILIDNMDRNDDENLAVIRSLPATVFITSRYRELEGFATYSIGAVDEGFGDLIFRDNYGKPLSAEDRDALSELLKNDVWRHTLTLRFLGHAASANGWTVAQLRRNLAEDLNLVRMDGTDEYGSMRRLYQRMYADSRLKKRMGRLLRVWSVLPYQSYPLSFLETFLSGYGEAEGKARPEKRGAGGSGCGETPEKEDAGGIRGHLEELYAAGWLEMRDGGYSMHPFVAECVRSDGVRVRDIAPLLEKIAAEWRKQGTEPGLESIVALLFEGGGYPVDADPALKEVMALLPSVLSLVQGRFGGILLDLGMLAYGICAAGIGRSLEGQKGLLQLKKRSIEPDRERRALLYLLLCVYGYWDPKEYGAELLRQRQDPAMDPRIKKMFLKELILLNYSAGGLELKELTESLQGVRPADDIWPLACLQSATTASTRGDIASMGEWLEKGVEAVRDREQGRGMIRDALLNARIVFYLSVQRLEEAQAALDEYEAFLGEPAELDSRMTVAFFRGAIASHRGDEGYGIETLEEAWRLGRALYQGMANELRCASILSELAIACNKAGRQEEAVESYRRLILFFEKAPGEEFQLHRTLNNLGVVYLDMEKPREALPYLERSLEIVKGVGGLGLGETLNNLARAWRMLGERDRELACLEEALPILEQFYGSGHPKVADGKKRLVEIS